MILVKRLFILFLGVLTAWGAFKPQVFYFLDGANLLFHEAGHVFFGFLGQTIGIWGGTLFQLLFPFGLAIAFLIKKDRYAASIMFYWFGENFLPISVYIRDARAQALQYVGGEIHDWGYILGRAQLLEHDHLIGNIAWTVGMIVMYTSVVFGLYSLKSVPSKK